MKNSRADTYKAIIITLAVFTFFGGLIAGCLTAIKNSDFNFSVAMLVWCSDIVFTLFSLLMSDILSKLEEIQANNNKQ